MVKGGKDNRKQRRRQRPKVFHRPNAATDTDVHDADASRQNEEVIESEPYRQNEGVVDSVVADADQTQDDTTNIMEDDSPHTTIPDETVSQSKVEPIPLPINELLSGYRLIDINIRSVLFKHVSCSICKAVGLLLCQNKNMDSHLLLHFPVLNVIGNMNSVRRQANQKCLILITRLYIQ